MGKLWRTAAWVKLLPAMLVAISMLFAPVVSAFPTPCHDEDVAQARAVGDPRQIASAGHEEHPSDDPAQIADHGKCCSVACSVYAPVADSVDLPGLRLTFVRPHFDLADQVADGQTIPPGLDPPRFPV